MDDAKSLRGIDPDYIGVDHPATDNERALPQETALKHAEAESWLLKAPEDPYNIRVLSHQCTAACKQLHYTSPPFTEDAVREAIWTPDDYTDLIGNSNGGSAFLVSRPWRFIVQTPLDDGPFVSLAVSIHGIKLKAVYTYDDSSFAPTRIMKDQRIFSTWLRSGKHIACLPLAVLQEDSRRTARELSIIKARLSETEDIIAQPMPTAHGHGAGSPNHGSDGGALRRFDRLHQTLHSCSSHLFNLERRARFEQDLVSTIELVIKEIQREAGQDVSVITSQIEMQKRLLASQAYDREMLPKRIQDQRSQIFSLVAQYNQQVNIEISHANMEIAESSRRIAEATMSDSASMKTIAILTMIFLPGTAIASFFSMTMFNWNADSGQDIATQYLWIYFVAAVPATAIVLGIWWACTQRRKRKLQERGVCQKIVLSHHGSDSE